MTGPLALISRSGSGTDCYDALRQQKAFKEITSNFFSSFLYCIYLILQDDHCTLIFITYCTVVLYVEGKIIYQLKLFLLSILITLQFVYLPKISQSTPSRGCKWECETGSVLSRPLNWTTGLFFGGVLLANKRSDGVPQITPNSPCSRIRRNSDPVSCELVVNLKLANPLLC